MLQMELNEIIEALKELEKTVFILHYGEVIAIIDEKTRIKPFTIQKDLEEGKIVLEFKPDENDF